MTELPSAVSSIHHCSLPKFNIEKQWNSASIGSAFWGSCPPARQMCVQYKVKVQCTSGQGTLATRLLVVCIRHNVSYRPCHLTEGLIKDMAVFAGRQQCQS